MLARVKEDCRLPAVRACGGVMFVKSEWMEVPAEHTLDALMHDMLEIKPVETTATLHVPDGPLPTSFADVLPNAKPVAPKKGGKK